MGRRFTFVGTGMVTDDWVGLAERCHSGWVLACEENARAWGAGFWAGDWRVESSLGD